MGRREKSEPNQIRHRSLTPDAGENRLLLTGAQRRSFRKTITTFFSRHARSLPWRTTTNPYHIFVSEVMLQQTQVDRVVDKYTQFVTAFPDWQRLATASLDKVLMVWQGLGYNRRAKFLKRAAERVVGEFGGELPRTPEGLAALPGIGAATAASIAAFAFDYPAVFVETNIRSVFIHHFFGNRADVADGEIRQLVGQTLDRKHPGRWYSALMDYGSELKRRLPNPSRRSKHHVRQSRFEGSGRQIRGAILRLLLEKPGLSQRTLEQRIDDAGERVPGILAALENEGMVRRVRGRYRIA